VGVNVGHGSTGIGVTCKEDVGHGGRVAVERAVAVGETGAAEGVAEGAGVVTAGATGVESAVAVGASAAVRVHMGAQAPNRMASHPIHTRRMATVPPRAGDTTSGPPGL